MDAIFEYGNQVLFRLGDFKVTISQLLVLTVGVIIISLISIMLNRFIKRNSIFSGLSQRLRILIARGTNYLVWVLGIFILLQIENVNTKAFFEYSIFSGDVVNFTVQKLFVLVVLLFVIRLIVLVVDYSMNRKIEKDRLDFGKAKSVLQITKYFIWIVGIFIAIGSIGLKLTFFIASISALLVGVGFGLQSIFNDFFSGIIILFDRSIQVHDVVQVGDIVGRVKEIGIRTTIVIDRDNMVLIIPNSKFTTDNVTNWSHMDEKSRFAVEVGVAYGSDVRLVEKVLLECADECDDIVKDPPPSVRFDDFGDSSLNFKLLFWSSNTFFAELIKSKLRFAIDQKFRENNITIPYPQRDLHIKTDETKIK